MGKAVTAGAKLQELARIVSSHNPIRSKTTPIVPMKPREVRVDTERAKLKKIEDNSLSLDGKSGLPLAQVVSDCVKRWFHDTLKEAKAGDIAMQVLVGQMYASGYGVPKDAQKGRAWINKASKGRCSVWKVGDKPPGYAASDSDSEEAKGDTK
ncbi:hypothetical protein K2173_004954 [Erythroxylum novogranatense]|uniref:Sel1-like protein n=1 Tax=Erythroxylum novogranatense TaxID=1862640 RepID=A0AAV8TCQ2_9ROSI|nr:hypothetical protein K2173_004954 [Erythroxylum novogranatense]